LGAVVVPAIVAVACSAEVPVTSTPEEAFCEAMSSVRDKCAGGCEATLGSECSAVAATLTPEARTRATDCFLSGACASVCLSKTLVDLAPTAGQTKIRDAYCGTCAKGQSSCAADFFTPPKPGTQGGAGVPLLAFSDEATSAVAEQCAAEEGCQLGFSTCALDATKKKMSALKDSAAECLVRGLRSEEGERRAPDGGAIVVTCTKANCAGCCRDDLCLVGDQKDACGRGGGTCETCSGTATCEAAACKLPCGPDTCAGCCENNECKDGTTKDSCGKGGSACTKCGASFACEGASCIDTSCKATCTGCCTGSTCLGGTAANACGRAGNACVDCGKGRTCSTTGCALDQNALFDVVLQGAVLPTTNKSMAAWDFGGGLPDPYVKAYSSLGATSHSGTTVFIADTTSPQYNFAVLASVPARELLSSFSIEVWDDDYDFDDFVGGCAIRLDATMFDGGLKSARCPATPSGVELTVSFRLVAK